MKARVGLVAAAAVATIGMVTSCTIPVADLGGTRSVAYGMNDAGVIVGVSPLPGTAQDRAFKRLPDDTAIDLGTLDGQTTSVARDVNDAGTTVGWSGATVVTWDAANQIHDLGFTGIPWDINDAGLFVGEGLPVPGRIHGGAFVYDPAVGHPVALPELPGSTLSVAWGLNDAGQAVGFVVVSGVSAPIPARWDLAAGTITDLRPIIGVGATVVDIADDGTMAGSALWKPGLPRIDLGFIAVDINDAGTVVGFRTNPLGSPTATTGGSNDAFLWSAATGRVPLGTDGQSSKAYAINDGGAVAGVGNGDGDTTGRAALLSEQ